MQIGPNGSHIMLEGGEIWTGMNASPGGGPYFR